MNPDALASAAARLARQLDALGRVSDEHGRLTRTFLSPAMRRANAWVAKVMRESGLKVHEDATGNVIGRREGEVSGAKTLLLGSHLDTVRDAGRFDGALGVLLPIAALADLRRRGVTLPFAVEVIGFSEEEGVRFASAYLGSKGYTGQLRPADLKKSDENGVTVQQALDAFNRRKFEPAPMRLRRSNLLGYIEAHIEQGPVLEKAGRAVGVVSAIAGQTRGRVTFVGRAGHAGTTPMGLRRDALAGAAEFVLRAESRARKQPPLVATVGTIAATPGAPNVIPGRVVVSLDIRHPSDDRRKSGLRRLLAEAREIARRRGLTCQWQQTQDNGAVACSPELSAVLAQSVRATRGRALKLVSGAGHDAVVMSNRMPVGMLFVRCRGGLSHHPDEHVSPLDLKVALRVMVDFLERLAKREARHGQQPS